MSILVGLEATKPLFPVAGKPPSPSRHPLSKNLQLFLNARVANFKEERGLQLLPADRSHPHAG